MPTRQLRQANKKVSQVLDDLFCLPSSRLELIYLTWSCCCFCLTLLTSQSQLFASMRHFNVVTVSCRVWCFFCVPSLGGHLLEMVRSWAKWVSFPLEENLNKAMQKQSLTGDTGEKSGPDVPGATTSLAGWLVLEGIVWKATCLSWNTTKQVDFEGFEQKFCFLLVESLRMMMLSLLTDAFFKSAAGKFVGF